MDTAAELWKKTKIQYKVTFFSTILFGLISQGMGLFNQISLHDDVQYFFHQDNVIVWGRWALHLLIKAERHFFLDGNYSLPVINGFITIFCIGIAFCILVDLLDIRSFVLCALLGGGAVSFPGVTSLFGHMYTAHYYALALLFSVLGPYLILKKTKWYAVLCGIGLMVVSTGIYQAYIPVMLCVFLLGLMKLCADVTDREDRTALYKKIGLVLVSGILFVSLYFLITKLFLDRYHMTLTTYKNIDSMGKLSLKIYLGRITTAYREFFFPSVNNMYDVFPGMVRILNWGMMALSLPLFGMLLYSVREKPADLVILLLLFLLFPLAVDFIFVMVDREFCNSLMVYSKTMPFVFFAWVLERADGALRRKLARLAWHCCTGVLALIVLMYCRFDNVMYMEMTMLQTAVTRYFTTLVTRIQSTEGYDSWKYVAYIGIPQPGRNDNSVENVRELDHINLPPVHFGLQNALKVSWKNYMRYWCGFTAHEIDPTEMMKRPDVQAMPHYPEEGSIKVIDDIVVVNF